MGIWEFDPTILTGVAQALGPLASAFDDHSRSLAARAQSAQARGGSSDVGDRIRFASSIVGGHGDALRSESLDLQNRITLAQSADDSPVDDAPASARLVATAAGTAQAIEVPGIRQQLALADQALQRLGYVRDIWGLFAKSPAAGLTGLDVVFAAGTMLLESPQDPNFREQPMLAFAKVGLKEVSSLVVQDSVEWAVGAAVGASGPVALVGVAAGLIAADEVGHVVDEAFKKNWGGDFQAKGVNGLADDIWSVGATSTLETGADIWNGVAGVLNVAAGALNVTGQAGQIAGKDFRAGVDGALNVTAQAGQIVGEDLRGGVAGVGRFVMSFAAAADNTSTGGGGSW